MRRSYPRTPFPTEAPLDKFLAEVVHFSRRDGWQKRDERTGQRSTAWTAWMSASAPCSALANDEDRAEAAEVLAFASVWFDARTERGGMTDFDSKMAAPLARGDGKVRKDEVGPVAYLVQLKAREQVRGPEALLTGGMAPDRSRHVGAVGQRFEATCVAEFVKHLGERAVGPRFYFNGRMAQHGADRYLVKLRTEDGDLLTWFTANAPEQGWRGVVAGTVKAHEEYKGTKQTIVTRCRLTEVH